jgi:hypothetical protein
MAKLVHQNRNKHDDHPGDKLCRTSPLTAGADAHQARHQPKVRVNADWKTEDAETKVALTWRRFGEEHMAVRDARLKNLLPFNK